VIRRPRHVTTITDQDGSFRHTANEDARRYRAYAHQATPRNAFNIKEP
jgi:hypothetical protein